jgi:hypothetical protein
VIPSGVGRGWALVIGAGLAVCGPACLDGARDDRQLHLDLLADCWGLADVEAPAASCAERIGPRAVELGLIAPSRLAAPDAAPPAITDTAAEIEEIVEIPGSGLAEESAESAPAPVAEQPLEQPTEAGEPLSGAAEQDPVALQIDAIAMYNAHEPGWEEAVEAALAHPQLVHAPNLCFAGIEPAYAQQRYEAVLDRAEVVWANLDKGYLQGTGQLTSVCEYACRAGFQDHMQGRGSVDGELWCRRWAGRLEREGASTAEADELLAQME